MANDRSRDMILTSIIKKIHDGEELDPAERTLYERVLRGG